MLNLMYRSVEIHRLVYLEINLNLLIYVPVFMIFLTMYIKYTVSSLWLRCCTRVHMMIKFRIHQGWQPLVRVNSGRVQFFVCCQQNALVCWSVSSSIQHSFVVLLRHDKPLDWFNSFHAFTDKLFKFGGWTHCQTPRAWLISSYPLPILHHFLASDSLSSFGTVVDNSTFQIKFKFNEWSHYGIPRAWFHFWPCSTEFLLFLASDIWAVSTHL